MMNLNAHCELGHIWTSVLVGAQRDRHELRLDLRMRLGHRKSVKHYTIPVSKAGAKILWTLLKSESIDVRKKPRIRVPNPDCENGVVLLKVKGKTMRGTCQRSNSKKCYFSWHFQLAKEKNCVIIRENSLSKRGGKHASIRLETLILALTPANSLAPSFTHLSPQRPRRGRFLNKWCQHCAGAESFASGKSNE